MMGLVLYEKTFENEIRSEVSIRIESVAHSHTPEVLVRLKGPLSVSENFITFKEAYELRDALIGALGPARAADERREELKRAFIAGCRATLSWCNAGMPQDDLDEAGYDYARQVLATDSIHG